MTEQLRDQKTTASTAGQLSTAGATDTIGSLDTAGTNTVGTSTTGTNTVGVNTADASDADDSTAAASTPALETRHAVLRYTTLRLALFLVALLLVWGVAVVFNMDLSSQLSKLTLLAVALLLSSAASFIVLSKYRDAMSAGIVARTQRLSKQFDDAAAFEDEDE